MKISPIPTHMLSQKLLARISAEFRRVYQVPDEHGSVGMFTADNDDVAYLAVDDATKEARIQVLKAETFYGGEGCSWSRYGGKIEVIISGPKVEDVRNGLRYVRDYIERKGGLFCFDDNPTMAFFARTMERTGKYFAGKYSIPEGDAYTYLVGGPIESSYAIDKALKASKTTIRQFFEPPSHANSSGVILSGSESACRSAERAYIEALRSVQMAPLAL